MIYAVLVVLVIMLVVFVNYIEKIQELHQAERSEMLDRLMCKDLDEFKQHADAQPVIVSGPVDMDEEEEYLREIELNKSR